MDTSSEYRWLNYRWVVEQIPSRQKSVKKSSFKTDAFYSLASFLFLVVASLNLKEIEGMEYLCDILWNRLI